MRKTYLMATLMLAGFAAPAVAAAQHDVTWYLANAQQRAATLASCQANPGDLATTPDCVNAEAAQRQLVIGGL